MAKTVHTQNRVATAGNGGSGTMELLYGRRDALERHHCAPLLREREQFLLHLLRQGTSRIAVQNVALYLLLAVRFLKLKTLRDIDRQEIEGAILEIWGHRLSDCSRFPGYYSAYRFRYAINK